MRIISSSIRLFSGSLLCAAPHGWKACLWGQRGVSPAPPSVCPERIGSDNKFIQKIYFSINRQPWRHNTRKPRQKSAIMPITYSLHNMNYADFVSGRCTFSSSEHQRSPERTMLKSPFCGLAETQRKQFWYLQANSRALAMVLFFHCSFPEHNSYRFA